MDNGLIHSARLEQHLLDVAEPVVLEIFQVCRRPEKLQVRVHSGGRCRWTRAIGKLPIAKTLLNLQNLAKRKTYLRNLVKLVFMKACENSHL